MTFPLREKVKTSCLERPIGTRIPGNIVFQSGPKIAMHTYHENMKVLTNGRTYEITDLDPRQLEALVSAGFKVAVLPKQQYAVVSSFPLKTSLSLYVAIFRVYPRLRNYIAQMSLCAYPAIEICNTTRMDFMMPLSRQEEFFVPEFSEEQASAPPCFTCLIKLMKLSQI